MQPANLMVIASQFTERAGGRPPTDVRLASSRLVQVADLDVVPDAADTGELRDHRLCRFPLNAGAHGSGEGDVAVFRRRLDPSRYGAAQGERVAGHGGQGQVV